MFKYRLMSGKRQPDQQMRLAQRAQPRINGDCEHRDPTVSSPRLALPNVMLPAALAVGNEEYARQGFDIWARSHKLNKTLELIRLLPWKVVKHLSIY